MLVVTACRVALLFFVPLVHKHVVVVLTVVPLVRKLIVVHLLRARCRIACRESLVASPVVMLLPLAAPLLRTIVVRTACREPLFASLVVVQ